MDIYVMTQDRLEVWLVKGIVIYSDCLNGRYTKDYEIRGFGSIYSEDNGVSLGFYSDLEKAEQVITKFYQRINRFMNSDKTTITFTMPKEWELD